MMTANQSAAVTCQSWAEAEANRRPAGQSDGPLATCRSSDNLAAIVAADPADCGTAVAELDR